MIELSASITPISPVKRIVKVYSFTGLLAEDPMPRQFTIMFHMDRRQLRRYARKTGKRFRMKNGEAKWR